MRDFRQLDVWHRAHALVLAVYGVSARFPRSEGYGLTSQLRRAATSIPTNLAGGCGRGSDGDFSRFVQISMGSASECEYLLILAHDLEYISPADYQALAEDLAQIKRMVTGLLKSLAPSRPRRKSTPPRPGAPYP